jgi:hypothetical protein
MIEKTWEIFNGSFSRCHHHRCVPDCWFDYLAPICGFDCLFDLWLVLGGGVNDLASNKSSYKLVRETPKSWSLKSIFDWFI